MYIIVIFHHINCVKKLYSIYVKKKTVHLVFVEISISTGGICSVLNVRVSSWRCYTSATSVKYCEKLSVLCDPLMDKEVFSSPTVGVCRCAT